MGKSRVFSGCLALLGLLISLTPLWIAPTCTGNLELKSGAFVHMKCFWTGQATIVLGLMVFFTALLMLVAKAPETLRFLSFIQVLYAVALYLIPQDFLIGICAKTAMACHTTVFYLYSWVGLLLAVTAAILVFARVEQKPEGSLNA